MSLRLRVPGERVGTTHSYVKLQCDTPNLSFGQVSELHSDNVIKMVTYQRMNGKREWQKMSQRIRQ